MRRFHTSKHSLRHISASVEYHRGIELSAQGEQDLTASRHDPQLLATPPVPVDPYTAWLAQREADRRRDDRLIVRFMPRQRSVCGPVARGSRSPSGR
jgi:hypothetical protein